jgi:diaminopimelate decarboxylase
MFKSRAASRAATPGDAALPPAALHWKKDRMHLEPSLLQSLAETVGTPFWLYEAAVIRQRIADIQFLTGDGSLQPRFAMKSCPATKVLREMQRAGIWIDAVSGNEVLRARHAGFAGGSQPPQILFTADVFRDNALEVLQTESILPNAGSPGMLANLAAAGYRGPVSLRVNPGFGHGHVNACDTGGPSSKHGIWWEDLRATIHEAGRLGLTVTMLHAHIGSGPQWQELHANLTRLAEEFAGFAREFPTLEAVSLGGGIPFNYRRRDEQIALPPLRDLFLACRARLCETAGRDLRVEIEPGRYYVAPAGTLITRVTDIKKTRTNEKGPGVTFAMADAGFVDLVRPAMYGSYHQIEVVGRPDGPTEDLVVAGPLCESGDVFTRDDAELLVPRALPRVTPGDLLALRDAGAYGYAMSSNYNSIGRAPQLWLEPDGSVELISRRETVEDLLRAETSEPILPA